MLNVQHPALKGRVVEEFAELRLRKDVVDAVRNIGVTQPTVIQVSQMDCRHAQEWKEDTSPRKI